jgi:hypothetical protein
MRIKSLISLLGVACLLMLTISPLLARNTPYPERLRGSQAHPWQDDDQVTDEEVTVQFAVVVGPITITVAIPAEWLGVDVNKPRVISHAPTNKVKSPRPMSLNQKGDTR